MSVGKTHLGLCLAVIVALAGFGLTPAWGARSRLPAPAHQPLMVFPFDVYSGAKVPDGFGADLASALRSMLSGASRYRVYLYSERLSPIKRAKDDNTIKAQDAAPPFTEDKAKTLKLAQILATDLYLTGGIEDFQADTAKKTAQMTLSADVLDGKTGKLVKTFLVTGYAPESAKASDEEELRALAAGDAVSKLKAEIVAQSKEKAGLAPDVPLVQSSQ